MPQGRLNNVDAYRNLIIGLSLVNNADLESGIVDHDFVSSQCICNAVTSVLWRLIKTPTYLFACLLTYLYSDLILCCSGCFE